LTFVLATAALADDGIIHGDLLPPPPPTSATTSEPQSLDAATTGDISNTTDAIAEAALRVIGDLLAIY
jgi:hypothetical protein